MKSIEAIWNEQRSYFRSGVTLSYEFRLNNLKKLRQLLIDHEREIFDSMNSDLGRTDYDTYMAENVVVFDELKVAISNLKEWMKPSVVSTSMQFQPATSRIEYQPLGQVLIISPWNYPFHLSLAPLVGAIAAGNCAILKPSEMAPNASAVLARIINSNFESGHVRVVEGGKEVAEELLSIRHDLVFYTGSTEVGKLVYSAAAKHLTPVVLELGGKCPCIVHSDAHLKTAVKRIAWGKFLNAGQTCLAPDYVLVHRSIKDRFLKELQETLKEFFTDRPLDSSSWPRIVNERHFDRLSGLKQHGTVVLNGGEDRNTLKMGPSLIELAEPTGPLMESEIFGPILPILTYDSIASVLAVIGQNPDPLALYLFTKDDNVEKVILQNTRSGGVAINDCLLHAANGNMPFGGVGISGIGMYHHRYSFETFSHAKGVLKKATWFDPSMRYPPYSDSDLRMLKKFTL